MRFALASLALVAAQEPEDAWYPGRKLWSRAPATTKTGCTVMEGKKLPKPTASSPDAVNEPCYIHDGGTCVGYQVCCVKIGTCLTRGGIVVSSNTKYYMGGCLSTSSDPDRNPATATVLPTGCAKQGECAEMYLEHMMGATTEPGVKNDLSPYVQEEFMSNSSGCAAYFTPPIPIYGFALIAVGAVVVVVILAVVVKMTLCKKKAPPAKGAPE